MANRQNICITIDPALLVVAKKLAAERGLVLSRYIGQLIMDAAESKSVSTGATDHLADLRQQIADQRKQLETKDALIVELLGKRVAGSGSEAAPARRGGKTTAA